MVPRDPLQQSHPIAGIKQLPAGRIEAFWLAPGGAKSCSQARQGLGRIIELRLSPQGRHPTYGDYFDVAPAGLSRPERPETRDLRPWLHDLALRGRSQLHNPRRGEGAGTIAVCFSLKASTQTF